MLSPLRFARNKISRARSARSASATAPSNPLLQSWDGPYGLPHFKDIKPEHFKPAFDVVLERHLDEIKAIATNPSPPSFDNTIHALDKAGKDYVKISYLFSNLCSSVTNPALQEVEVLMSPIIAAHDNKISTYPGLFPRVDAVHASLQTSSDLDDQAKRLTERIHLDFVRAGAKFDEAKQKENAEIVQKLASLETEFAQNVLKDEEVTIGPLTEDDMAGCPPDLKQAAREAASSLGHKEGYIISLSRSLVEPFLTFADKRDLREAAWLKWTKRGELDPSRDNRKIAKEILLLRSKQAELHGYETFAQYQTADTMAKSPDRVLDLLNNVWEKAKLSANAEREALESFVASLESNPLNGSKLEPWDWRYYAEKVRSSKYDFDESLVKPYFSLKAVTNAVFDCAGKLFGLRFVLTDVAAYHPDVKVYEVRETGPDGKDQLRAVFFHDNFMRQGKRSGAWMSELRGALPSEGVVPIILNNNNFAKGPDNGEGSLLSYDDARTLFHEFGHGLHGMLSEAKFNRLAGTNVLRDFVELPSQLMEHWIAEPQVLKQHALHIETKDPIPDELLDRLKAARNYGQGFATIEYTSSALVDQALHALPRAELEKLDLATFEQEELSRLQMPQGIIMRHRPAHFQHLFASSSYASAYYVYLWAEVLDADGFDAFKVDKKDIFDQETAKKLRKFIYSSGNTLEPGAAYRAFRGRDPVVEPMLAKKGLLVTV